jgi:hypothetical protein
MPPLSALPSGGVGVSPHPNPLSAGEGIMRESLQAEVHYPGYESASRSAETRVQNVS